MEVAGHTLKGTGARNDGAVGMEVAGHTLKGTGARNDGAVGVEVAGQARNDGAVERVWVSHDDERVMQLSRWLLQVPKGRNFHNRRQAKRSLRTATYRGLAHGAEAPHAGQGLHPCAMQNAWTCYPYRRLGVASPKSFPRLQQKKIIEILFIKKKEYLCNRDLRFERADVEIKRTFFFDRF
jgi:hypothetical protein